VTDRPNELTVREAVAKIARGELTSEALVRSCLERIAEREPAVGAWQHLDPEQALAQARRLDSVGASGPLHGVPVGIKDVYDTADMPTTYGSNIYRGYRPAADTALVATLRRAGMVILGKTVTTEFASGFPAGTRNPRDLDRSPGVSSSGSAAAIADGMVPFATGTQTGGSIIRPAAFCGVYGFKSSLDGLDRAGYRHCKPTLDTMGLFARSIEDIALVQEAVTSVPSADELGTAPRIGLCLTPFRDDATAPMVAALERAASRLGAAGARVSEAALPESFGQLPKTWDVINSVESARALAREFEEEAAKMNPRLREKLAAGFETPEPAFRAALDHAQRCRTALAAAFDDYDVLLTPSAHGVATRLDEPALPPTFNAFWTLLHVPCVSIPDFSDPSGLPLGLQLIGAVGSDHRFLAAARWIDAKLHAAS
jgi:Asp-tRNA(Asn)/Glu-tRNA(Gln) amidotransferase A subunit family amidase